MKLNNIFIQMRIFIHSMFDFLQFRQQKFDSMDNNSMDNNSDDLETTELFNDFSYETLI
jgi:hypothetical protein